MTTIVTRAGKGSALTWTEGDSNFTNLNTAKLENISEDLTPTLGGNLDVNEKTLTGVKAVQGNIDGITIKNSSGTNLISVGIAGVDYCTVNANIVRTVSGDESITIQPNGTGDINLSADTVVVGDSAAAATITTNGAGNLTISTNSGTNSGTIVINQGADGNIALTPNGTGDVQLVADTVVVGDAAAAAIITTNGAGNLTLSTNNGTNSGTIAITQGASANITVTPNGTGLFLVSGQTVGVRTNNTTGVIIGRNQTTTSGAYQYPALMAQKVRTDILTAAMTLEPATIGFSTRDSASVNTNFGRLSCSYQGTGSNPFFRASVSVDTFTTNLDCAIIGVGTAQWGNTTGGYTHTTPGAGNLTLSTNNGTNSGTIVITNGVNGAITLTPNGTGRVTIGNPLRLASYTAAALTALTGSVGDVAAVTNSASGPHPNGMLAFWDTTNARWSYMHDNSAV